VRSIFEIREVSLLCKSLGRDRLVEETEAHILVGLLLLLFLLLLLGLLGGTTSSGSTTSGGTGTTRRNGSKLLGTLSDEL
jgi:hypothetical protein